MGITSKFAIVPENVCSDKILVEVEDGILKSVEFVGGCDGNGKALGRLLTGMKAEKAIELLRGVDCEGKGTSCADQLSHGIEREFRGDA